MNLNSFTNIVYDLIGLSESEVEQIKLENSHSGTSNPSNTPATSTKPPNAHPHPSNSTGQQPSSLTTQTQDYNEPDPNVNEIPVWTQTVRTSSQLLSSLLYSLSFTDQQVASNIHDEEEDDEPRYHPSLEEEEVGRERDVLGSEASKRVNKSSHGLNPIESPKRGSKERVNSARSSFEEAVDAVFDSSYYNHHDITLVDPYASRPSLDNEEE